MTLAQDSESGEATGRPCRCRRRHVAERLRKQGRPRSVDSDILATRRRGARWPSSHTARPASSATRRTSEAPGGERTRTSCDGAIWTASHRPEQFAFMISLKQARLFQQRLAQNEEIRTARGRSRAGRRPGHYEVVKRDDSRRGSARGRPRRLRSAAISITSGRAPTTMRAVARRFSRPRAVCATLIRDKRIPAPARTLRFIWPPEIEGTLVLLNARPELAARIKAVVHMDMVGGAPAETKAILHVTRGPASLPSFVNDVAEAISRLCQRPDQGTFKHLNSGDDQFHAPEGGKEALAGRAGGVHAWQRSNQIYADSSFGIPAIST